MCRVRFFFLLKAVYKNSTNNLYIQGHPDTTIATSRHFNILVSKMTVSEQPTTALPERSRDD